MGTRSKKTADGLREEKLLVYVCPIGHKSLATGKGDGFECLRCEIDAINAPPPHLDARNAIEESMAKMSGVLGVITSFAREENFKDVQNACWMVADEIERLQERLGDLGL